MSHIEMNTQMSLEENVSRMFCFEVLYRIPQSSENILA
jgi:hypothetical protein